MNSRLVSRVGAAFLAANGFLIGGYIMISPRHFYDEFPFGEAWVAADGPFNEHLLRDFGSMNLALGVVAVAAAVWLTRPVLLAAALGWLVYSVPHLAYHSLNLEPYDSATQVALVVTLLGPPVVALLVLVVSLRPGREAAAGAGLPA